MRMRRREQYCPARVTPSGIVTLELKLVRAPLSQTGLISRFGLVMELEVTSANRHCIAAKVPPEFPGVKPLVWKES